MKYYIAYSSDPRKFWIYQLINDEYICVYDYLPNYRGNNVGSTKTIDEIDKYHEVYNYLLGDKFLTEEEFKQIMLEIL